MHVNGPHVSATIAVAHCVSVAQQTKSAGLTDRDGTANSRLTFLHSEIRQQHTEDVLRADSLGDVTERIDRSSSNRLLVRFEEIE